MTTSTMTPENRLAEGNGPKAFRAPPLPTYATESIIFDLESDKAKMGALWFKRITKWAELDRREVWKSDGCMDMGQWVAGQDGISWYRANRYIDAGKAITRLPLMSEALKEGTLDIERAVELCRFATPETEERLLAWSKGVSVGQIKWKADLETKPDVEEPQAAENARTFGYTLDEGRTRLSYWGNLPALEGLSFVKALDLHAERMKDMPEGEGEIGTRRADALMLLVKQQLAEDGSRDRATVVIHADLETLKLRDKYSEIQGGGAIHPAILDRLLCDSSLMMVLEEGGQPVGIGRISHNVPVWLLNLLKRRDQCCTFPGCEHKRFVHAHHIKWWIEGGLTNIDNLLLVCHFHHKLVHEHGWKVEMGDRPGTARWFRPNGTLYSAGHDPPSELLRSKWQEPPDLTMQGSF